MTKVAHPQRKTRRSENDPVGRTIGFGLAALALVGIFIWLGVIAFNGVPFRGYKTITVSVPDVGNLLHHDPVRIGGARVGQVEDVTLGPDGRPEVRLQIEPGTKLPADTQVRLRANGLLGARYVELVPGDSAALLGDGDSIRGGEDALTFGIPQALDTFDAPTREALQQMTDGLGTGFVGRGEDINEAIRLAPHGVSDSILLDREIAEDRSATQRLLPSMAAGFAPLADNAPQLGALLPVTADAIQPFVDAQDGLRGTLEEAPSALSSMRTGLGQGERLVDAAAGLATEIAHTVPLAPDGLRAATELLRKSPRPLARAATLLEAAEPAIPSVLRIAQAVAPLLKPLQNGLSDLTPMLLQLAPYKCNIENWGATMRSMDGFGGTTPDGPDGQPLGAFRAEAAIMSPGATIGIEDGTGLSPRDQYVPPCEYLPSIYPGERPMR